jgi:peptide/nickel transport system substrate-binding protein
VIRVDRFVLPLLLVALVGCAPSGPGVGGSRGGENTGAPAVRKSLVLAQLNATKMYGPWDFSNTSGGGSALIELHTIALKTSGPAGGIEPRIAARMPSFDDGSIVVLPDGRMRVTWKLREDVKWHDGAPLTAEDAVFSWQLAIRPDLMSSRRDYVTLAESMEATDRSTLIMTWPNTFAKALDLGADKYWIFPKHILAESFATMEGEAFMSQPFFTTNYIGNGPYRVVDWGLGENQVLESFDGYFLGKPKIDRITIRTIGDVNTLLVNMESRALDMTSEKTLPTDLFLRLNEQWTQSGAGVVRSRQENWRYIWFQFHPEYARPIEMSQDVRIRRGLLFGMDRNGLRELLLPGIEYTSGDTFMPQSDPRASIVGTPFARYAYDPRRALQELEDAGWRRGSDSKLLNPAGQQVQIELRGNEPDEKELAFVAAGWRQLGIEVTEYIPPSALARDNEFKSKFPGLETRARSTGDEIFVSFDGRLGSSAQNRWQGANTGHYANSALDRLIDKLEGTIDERGQGQVLKEMGEILATDLPALPAYFRSIFAAVGKGVRALDDYAFGQTGTLARQAHLWDRD